MDDDWEKFLESGDINRNDINENTYQEPLKYHYYIYQQN